MSVAECELDEPDQEYCEYHDGYLLPCRACRAEAAIERAEALRKEDRSHDLR